MTCSLTYVIANGATARSAFCKEIQKEKTKFKTLNMKIGTSFTHKVQLDNRKTIDHFYKDFDTSAISIPMLSNTKYNIYYYCYY